MKSILRLLLGVMLASVTWTGQMNAGECSVDVKNLHMEAVLLPGTAGVYTVHASCRMQCRHHSGVYGLEREYTKSLFPIVVDVFSIDGKLGLSEEERKKQAIAEARRIVELAAMCMLREECGQASFSCNCLKSDCSCVGCKPMASDDSLILFPNVSSNVSTEQEIFRRLSKAVNLSYVTSLEGIEAAQDEYIAKNYPNLLKSDSVNKMYQYGLYLQLIVGRDKSSGNTQIIYFDMTDLYKKMEQSNDDAIREKVRQMMEEYK